MRLTQLELYLQVEQLPKLVFGLIALGLAYSLIQLIWLFKPLNLTAAVVQTDDTIKSLPSIANWHLFGVYQPSSSASLQETTLPLKLVGIFFYTPPSKSLILVSVSGQPAKLYAKGQNLLPGVEIEDVLHESAILKHNGNLESLTLPITKLKFAPPPRLLDLNQGS